ncbi:hypothetical protein EVAR_26572_1 [Eumeta japonica]|uniref:Uncharacterized protein n=1 Tax=Eumeta variegata TaxID=151549 RepID=A0A4C1W7N7_EUMVA|nr:hypothetical protein EVAR_26572_1 [Eumeta japonica]
MRGQTSPLVESETKVTLAAHRPARRRSIGIHRAPPAPAGGECFRRVKNECRKNNNLERRNPRNAAPPPHGAGSSPRFPELSLRLIAPAPDFSGLNTRKVYWLKFTA